jgi:hypothetical protein
MVPIGLTGEEPRHPKRAGSTLKNTLNDPVSNGWTRAEGAFTKK